MTVVLAVAAVLYGMRVAGLAVPRLEVPAAWDRTLGFVPVAVLAALTAGGLAGLPHAGVAPWVAAAGGAWAGRRTRRMWVCIAAGLALFGLMKLIF